MGGVTSPLFALAPTLPFSPAAAAILNDSSKHTQTRDQEKQTLDKRPKKVDGDTLDLPNQSYYAGERKGIAPARADDKHLPPGLIQRASPTAPGLLRLTPGFGLHPPPY